MTWNWKGFMVAMFWIVIFYFILSTILWALWNATIPELTKSLNGGTTQPFANISYPTGLLFGLLVIFLAMPISGAHKMVTNYNFIEMTPSWGRQEQVEVIEVEDM